MGKRIGIFGGSFDPIHQGHLILAEQIRCRADLDEIVFVPAYISPFKIGMNPCEGRHRLNMIRQAIRGHAGFSVSSIELKKNAPSYTYDTLSALQKKYGKRAKLYFLIGTDAFLSIEDWVRSEELLREFSFLIGLRKGYMEEELFDVLDRLRDRYPSLNAEYIRIPELEISASELRELMSAGRSVKYLLPERVIKYIEANELYLGLLGRVRRFVEKNQKRSRYSHTMGVVKLARDMAKFYGEDPEKAELAALFHDAYRSEGNIKHGHTAADRLREDFGVEDEDVLAAVRWHTTGRPGMSTLEKIIYIADVLEEGRNFRTSDELRAIAYKDLDKCLYRLMKQTKKHVEDLGYRFEPASEEVMKELESKFMEEQSREN